jgi:hypothetical protein
VQYLAIRYTERLGAARAVSSVGSVGDSYDNRPGRVGGRALRPNSSASADDGEDDRTLLLLAEYRLEIVLREPVARHDR